MNPFLNELARHLAGKWLSLLVLPGALFGAVAAAAWRMRYGRWAGAEGLVADLRDGAVTGAGLAALVLAALLLAAAAGLAAGAAGRSLHWLWLGQWPGRTGDPLTRLRHRRWTRAQEKYGQALREGAPDPVLARLAQRRNDIALAPPSRPTRMGDEIAALSIRVDLEYGLDLEFGWPRLWLTLPEEARAVLDASKDALTRASALAGWGVLYTLTGLVWWPVALLGLGTLLTSVARGRSAVTQLARLMESAVDLHGVALATALGIDTPEGRLTRETGRAVTGRIRKGA
ncbi:hypothetical protein ACIREE_00650 [Streptomyces sp. NPDC102467]|uniref:hypothetical protein n=1 Tax=Streptomyces sp. NPDC102467 TaxID=3366179 RepID=UPI0038138B72